MEGFLSRVSTIAPAKIVAYRATHYRVCAPGKAFTLLIGTVAFMFGIAMIVIYVWSALGWLDGLNLQG